MQIRTRLSLAFFVIAACILAGLFAYVYWAFKKDSDELFYQNLRSKALVSAQALMPEADQLMPLAATLGNEEDTLPYRDNISLFDQSYRRVFSAQADAPEVGARVLQLALRGEEARFSHHNLEALAILSYSRSNQPYVVIAEGFYDQSGIRQLGKLLIISYLAGLFILLAGTWYFTGRAFRPVSRFMSEINGLSPEHPEQRLQTQGETNEIAMLAETFNKMLDRVENAFRMQRMFLSNVSHELKNPLTAIRAQIEVALQRERDPQAYRSALDSILDDVSRISELEEKLLQLARLYNDPSGIHFEKLRLDELIWQTKLQLLKNHPDYQVNIEFYNLPEDADKLLVSANEHLLQSALLNLLNNACKYSPDHRAQLVAVFDAGGAHRVDISDNGPGIPPEEHTLIFEPFYRGPQQRNIKGSGIGLSLTKSILELHQVAISVDNLPTRGAVFSLRFSTIF